MAPEYLRFLIVSGNLDLHIGHLDHKSIELEGKVVEFLQFELFEHVHAQNDWVHSVSVKN